MLNFMYKMYRLLLQFVTHFVTDIFVEHSTEALPILRIWSVKGEGPFHSINLKVLEMPGDDVYKLFIKSCTIEYYVLYV